MAIKPKNIRILVNIPEQRFKLQRDEKIKIIILSFIISTFSPNYLINKVA